MTFLRETKDSTKLVYIQNEDIRNRLKIYPYITKFNNTQLIVKNV